jgi:pSer/pThr/pTyr-binding forkhead associated (FHA) protein
MAVTVTVHSPCAENRPLTFDSPRIVIGRGEGCEVRLPDPSVSHRHASIRQHGAEYLVQDEGSSNGTFVGKVRLPPGAPRVLRPNDRVRVGRVWLIIRIEQAPVTQNPAVATKELALRLVAQGLAAEGEESKPRLEVIEGPEAGKRLELVEDDRPYVVGRGRRVDLSLEDLDLSRHHLQVIRKGTRLLLRDLSSKNGSTLDGEPVPGDRDVSWPTGKTVRIGAHVLAFDDPVSETLQAIERAQDERLPEGEAPEAPPPGEAKAEADAETLQSESAPPSASPARPRDSARSSPPQSEPPKARRASPIAMRTRSGWTATDYLVALAALAVLTLSILAIFWLFTGA